MNPDFNNDAHESLAVWALLFNIGETTLGAIHLTRKFQQEMKMAGRLTTQRFVIAENPKPSESIEKRNVPIRSRRVIMRPGPSDEHDIDAIVMWTPLENRKKATDIPTSAPTTAFLQVYHRSLDPAAPLRSERLVVGDVVQRFNYVSDLVSMDGNRTFHNPLQPQTAPLAEVERLDRLIVESPYGQQTSASLNIT